MRASGLDVLGRAFGDLDRAEEDKEGVDEVEVTVGYETLLEALGITAEAPAADDNDVNIEGPELDRNGSESYNLSDEVDSEERIDVVLVFVSWLRS